MRRAEGGWYLKFDDGREVDVVSPVLIGRNPAPRPDEVGVALISSGEPSHTISRTHLLIGTDARGIYVTDRGSTNGTGLVLPGGRVEPCQPGAQTHIREGQKIKFGERFLTIERRK